jgi:hypothetical protein
MWVLTSVYMDMHCFMDNIAKSKILLEQKSSLKHKFSFHATSTKNTILSVVYSGQSHNLLTSAAVIEVQMGEMSKLGWVIGWSTRTMWAASCISHMC